MEDFKENFKNGSVETNCSLCTQANIQNIFPDSQKHFLNCSIISDKVPKISNLLEHEIYSIRKVNIDSVKILVEAINARKQLLENSS